ncbi:MAG: (Fe-S)-binding protein [Deltaproteobacteria bacterium]|nr:(Fe-S)-binding protein [Deltaproteobacteria bacterium]
MRRSRKFISEVLTTLKENIRRTGDPLGMKGVYWTEWAKGLHLPRQGKTVLLTGRMYQMLPYIMQVTKIISSAKPLLSRGGLGAAVNLGNRFMGDKVIRFRAVGSGKVRTKGANALRGIASALSAVGAMPAYLYEHEPYSGVLLYDLGLDDYIEEHVKRVYRLLKEHNVEKVIGVDPHTTFMLREVYPRYIEEFTIEVKHYLEILSENVEELKDGSKISLEGEYVIHDSCYLSRELGVIEQVRRISESIGISLREPENAKLDTACCGGPIEYAFRDLTEKVSRTRIEELSAISRDVLVVCPICLINLQKYEKELGINVWDMGELLLRALQPRALQPR